MSLTKGNENVMKVLDLSTAHLPCETVVAVSAGTFVKKASMQSEYGFLMGVPEYDADSGSFPGYAIKCESMLLCLRRAVALECDYIMFDRDAETLEYLPVFDW